ncbi:MAG: hypothetical protein ACP5K2_03145 [bacterium]
MLEELVEKIKSSSKYREISERTILEIARIELPKHKSEKNLIKAVKNRLHQTYGAFLSKEESQKLRELVSILEKDRSDIKGIAKMILQLHQSTRERIDIYGELYREIFDTVSKPSSILDLACGLNPFSIPWMNIEGPINYYAYDIDAVVIESINKFLAILSYPQLARVKDVLFEEVEECVDVCFIFKFLPTAERIKRGLSVKLLETIRSKFIVVSFPLKSLSGKEKGMSDNYGRLFEPILQRGHYIVKRFILINEMFYILIKREK